MSIGCIIFDCDGVLLDSVPAKTRAFSRLVESYGVEAQKKFVKYHVEHGGVSRYQKFAWFFRQFLQREITPAESEAWGKKFRDLTQFEVLNCAKIAGAEDVLQTWYGKLPLYVCSGAPAEEQRLILREHGLEKYFKDIYGSPPAKADLLKCIVQKAKVVPQKALMVGDASTDLEASVKVGTLFYGVGELLKGGNYAWGKDLTALSDFIALHAN